MYGCFAFQCSIVGPSLSGPISECHLLRRFMTSFSAESARRSASRTNATSFLFALELDERHLGARAIGQANDDALRVRAIGLRMRKAVTRRRKKLAGYIAQYVVSHQLFR